MTDQTQRSRKGDNLSTSASTGTPGAGAAVRQTASEAKEAAGQVAGQAKEAVGQVAGQAREQVSSRLSGQKAQAAQSLGGVAQALRLTGQQLREQDQAGVTVYIDRVASQVERFSSYIEQHDVGELVGEVEHFARRQPALFLGGAFVLGLLGARFLKSSAPQRYQPSRYPLARQEDLAGPYMGGMDYQPPVERAVGINDAPSRTGLAGNTEGL